MIKLTADFFFWACIICFQGLKKDDHRPPYPKDALTRLDVRICIILTYLKYFKTRLCLVLIVANKLDISIFVQKNLMKLSLNT